MGSLVGGQSSNPQPGAVNSRLHMRSRVRQGYLAGLTCLVLAPKREEEIGGGRSMTILSKLAHHVRDASISFASCLCGKLTTIATDPSTMTKPTHWLTDNCSPNNSHPNSTATRGLI